MRRSSIKDANQTTCRINTTEVVLGASDRQLTGYRTNGYPPSLHFDPRYESGIAEFMPGIVLHTGPTTITIPEPNYWVDDSSSSTSGTIL
jgi:hypothetical protein